jgi:hypothetical protein
MCPTTTEWKDHDSNVLTRVQESMNYKFVSPKIQERELKNKIGDNANLLVGSNIDQVYGTKFTVVPAGKGGDPEWFREYIKAGNPAATNHNPINGADAVIATVVNSNHAYNVMFNIKNEALCVHDANRLVERAPDGIHVQISNNRRPFICEKGFFTPEQEAKLAKLGEIVQIVNPGENIFTVLGRTEITSIQPATDIFKVNNVNNHGSITSYIQILENVHKAIVIGEQNALNIIEINANKWGIEPSRVQVLQDEVLLHKEQLLPDPNSRINIVALHERHVANVSKLKPNLQNGNIELIPTQRDVDLLSNSNYTPSWEGLSSNTPSWLNLNSNSSYTTSWDGLSSNTPSWSSLNSNSSYTPSWDGLNLHSSFTTTPTLVSGENK